MAKFQDALKEGSLNINIASVLFIGTEPLLVANAEHVVFQEPVTATSTQAQLVDHEVYFRPKGNPTLQKVKPINYDDILKNSINLKGQQDPITSITASQPQEEAHRSHFDKEETESQHQMPNDTIILPAKLIIPTPKQKQEEEHQLHSHLEDLKPLDYDIATTSTAKDSENIISTQEPHVQLQGFDLRDEMTNIQFMLQQDTTCGIELYHVFNCNPDFGMSEILKIFIGNISLCVLVIDASKGFGDNEIGLLFDYEQYASRGLIINSCSDENLHSDIRHVELNKFSEFLITHTNGNPPQNYIFSMNCKDPNSSDKETGADIVAHTLSSTTSTMYPLSWYYFGIKLQELMAFRNLETLSVSKECMNIAEQLKMDQPTVIAALENLCDNNMLLYFPDALEDTVFSGVHVFSQIFSKLISSKDKKIVGIVNQFQLMKATEHLSSEFLLSQNLITMFIKLMILAPCDEHGDKYIIPSQLQLLTESERKIICSSAIGPNTEVVIFKCPSYGYEYICMLIVFILTVSSQKWEIFKDNSSGLPVCLYKNTTKLMLKGKCIITVSFISGYIEVYVESLDKLNQDFSVICETILQGLEKIKHTLNSHKAFEFGISFHCNCGEGNRIHVATYDKQSGFLICENNKSVTFDCNSSHEKFLPKTSGNNSY